MSWLSELLHSKIKITITWADLRNILLQNTDIAGDATAVAIVDNAMAELKAKFPTSKGWTITLKV
jgi:hypothetical protein